jgi:hypothetical protein
MINKGLNLRPISKFWTPCPSNVRHRLEGLFKISKKDDITSRETIGGRSTMGLDSRDTSSLVIPFRRASWLGGFKYAATYDLLQSIKDKNERSFLKALKSGGDPYVTLKVGNEKLAIIRLVIDKTI